MLHKDTWDLVELARAFRFAGYGSCRLDSVVAGEMNLENPRKIHFLKAERLLSQALRKVDEADQLANGSSRVHNLDPYLIRELKLVVLENLKRVFSHLSEPQEVRKIRPQLAHLYWLTNQPWQARNELISLWFGFLFQIMVRGCYYISITLNISLWVELRPTNDTIRLIRPIAAGLFIYSSFHFFLFEPGDRRKTFASLLLSLINFGADLHYTSGLPFSSILGILTPILISALPIMFYSKLLDLLAYFNWNERL